MAKFTKHNGQLSHQFYIGEINFLNLKKILRKNLSPTLPSPLFAFISNKKFEFFSNRTFEVPQCRNIRTKFKQTGIFFALPDGAL